MKGVIRKSSKICDWMLMQTKMLKTHLAAFILKLLLFVFFVLSRKIINKIYNLYFFFFSLTLYTNFFDALFPSFVPPVVY